MTRIFLIGYMGAGKTTLGKALAKAMGLEFIDLDWYIENRYRKTISQIFQEKGEEGFRLLEQKMLHEAGEIEDVVVSCGGGTPCFFDNMDFMNRQGQTLLLSASMEALVRRLTISRKKRPILKDKTPEQLEAFVRDALSQRAPFYTKAAFEVDSSFLESVPEIQDTVDKVRKILNI